jgi:heme/copper-type cytochrome/quinol oxidase subunit 2
MNLAVLNPVGEIAAQEKSLMITAVSLMLVVVVPVVKDWVKSSITIPLECNKFQ